MRLSYISIVFIALLATASRPLAQSSSPADSASKLGAAYEKLGFTVNHAEQFELCSEDFFFIDRTGEVFGGPGSKGIQGREAFRKVSKGWGISESVFEREQGLSMGPYHIVTGALSWKTAAGVWNRGVPFACVLGVDAGQVSSRRDFGDYSQFFTPQPKRAEALKKHAASYLKAFEAYDLGALEDMLHEDVVFIDELGKEVGLPSQTQGRDNVLEMLDGQSPRVKKLQIKPYHAIYSGRFCMFLAQQSCTLELGSVSGEVELPICLMLEFKNDKLIEQRLYLDHQAAAKRLQAAQK